MSGKILFSTALAAAALLRVTTAHAAPVYVALGDSITFGETDLNYVQSFGDRGYVSLFANTLAARNGGIRPTVVNLAIDGETASSFMTNAGRTPPVMGRGDAPLQLENLNYGNSTAISQGTLLANTVAAQRAQGNTVGTVTVTLGFNELAALSPAQNTPAAEAAAIAQIPGTLASYRANYTAVLNEIRSLAPNANLYLLGYYNPFPADPNSPAAPVFNAGGVALNGIIQDLAGQFGAAFVANAAPFVGNEARYTYQALQPAGSSVSGQFSGVLPIGNVHPNTLGYSVIAADVAAATVPTSVPEPGSWPMLAAGLAALGLVARQRAGTAGRAC
ncbi:MAG TPA: SGNH/GDSL hydrolase family protein [Acetobacteraceae bacterium]